MRDKFGLKHKVQNQLLILSDLTQTTAYHPLLVLSPQTPLGQLTLPDLFSFVELALQVTTLLNSVGYY